MNNIGKMKKEIHNFDSKYYESYKSASLLRQEGDKPYLYSYWKRYLKKLKPKGKLLDIGCGLGFFLKRMQDIYETYGIDISEYAVEEARKAAVRSKIKICSVIELPFEDNFFDDVTAFYIVEHLEEPSLFFKKIQRILKKDGSLVISTPNLDSFGARIKGKDKDSKNLPYHLRKKQWHGWRDNSHVNILPRREWRNLVEKNGFVIIRDGTDFLWDVPYFKHVPYKLQWLFFVGLTWILVWINGFYSWKLGENYICIAKKI